MGLELYARIEEFLDFEDEVKDLHSAFLKIIFEKNLDDIIDIGCGQGAFMLHLLANKKEAYGIDLSIEQIKICQAHNLRADVLDIKDVTDKFSCATAIFDVINYVPKADLLKFFKDTYNVLNKNSYFLFDVNTFFGFDEVAQGTLSIKEDDKFISIDAIFEDEKLQTDLTLFEKTSKNLYTKEEDSITQYYHETTILKEKLEACGFIIEDIINFNLHTQEEADKLIFVCKK